MTFSRAHVPYCGTPPSPVELLTRWNLDPVLICSLLAVAGVYWYAARNQATSRRRQAFFYTGWFVSGLALISPLCALSVSLFAARVGQHIVLILIGAPLVVAGRPGAVLSTLSMGTETCVDFLRSMAKPVPAAISFAMLLWFWHMPAPYTATFDSSLVYWMMHVTLYSGALFLWTALSVRDPAKLPQIIAAGVLSSIQMTFLGALIALSPRVLYVPHLFTTAAWGLSPLQDQEIGGLIMWVPGCAIFLTVALAGLVFAMRRADRTYA